MILYFTGTGNSKYVAKQIAKVTGDEIISMNDRIKEGRYDTLSSTRPYVFVVPTYAWRIPRIVENFINKTSLEGNKKAYFLMTCGTETGNAVHYLKKLCLDKGLEFMGNATIIMPENYIAMYPVPDQEESWKIIKNAEPSIQKAAECIKNEKSFQPEKITTAWKIQSKLINPVFYSVFVKDKGFYSTPSCISCAKCVKVCPVNNVQLVDKKPVWNGNCTHCMACICACPKEAIEYKNKSQGKPRYYITEKI